MIKFAPVIYYESGHKKTLLTGIVHSIRRNGEALTISRSDGRIGLGEGIDEFPYNGKCGCLIQSRGSRSGFFKFDNIILNGFLLGSSDTNPYSDQEMALWDPFADEIIATTFSKKNYDSALESYRGTNRPFKRILFGIPDSIEINIDSGRVTGESLYIPLKIMERNSEFNPIDIIDVGISQLKQFGKTKASVTFLTEELCASR